MSDHELEPSCDQMSYTISRSELPLSCPTDKMVLWNAHPKVYLPIEKTGSEICPYCGSQYILQD